MALGLTALASTSASAHRRDEYLQASRIAIDPERLEIELDLTPGIAIAPGVLAEIDRSGDGVVADGEAHAYAAHVLSGIRLEIDGQPLPLALVTRQFPALESMRNGEGTIRLALTAAMPPLPAGDHRVFYRNDHRRDIGVYLANALIPASDRVAVLAQRRDVDQRELTIEYALRDAGERRSRWWLPGGVAGAIVLLGGVMWWRKQLVRSTSRPFAARRVGWMSGRK